MVYNEAMVDDARAPGDDARPYRKRKRARQEEETRRRITEAVVELHRTVGPAATTVTAVAERAGVSRRTVYNHFPTEGDLVEACSAHWARRNPLPPPPAWSGIDDPAERLRVALAELFAFYRTNADMLGNVLRDADAVEPLGRIMEARWEPYLDAVVEVIAGAFARGSGTESAASGEATQRRVAAAVRVAVDFGAWRLLAARSADADEAVEVAARMVEGVVETPAAGEG